MCKVYTCINKTKQLCYIRLVDQFLKNGIKKIGKLELEQINIFFLKTLKNEMLNKYLYLKTLVIHVSMRLVLLTRMKELIIH